MPSQPAVTFCESCNNGIMLDIVGSLSRHHTLGYACHSCISTWEDSHFKCQYCGEHFFLEDCHCDHDNTCVSCGDNNTACDDCGDMVPSDTLRGVDGGDMVCESCLDSDYTACNACGDYFPNGAMHTDNSSAYCNSCYSDHYNTCDQCGDIYHSNSGYSSENGDSYCSESCYSHYWWYCSDCESEFANGEACNCRNDDNIASHNYKPHWEKIGNGPIYAGIEIEAEANRSVDNDDNAAEVREILGSYCATIKEDGSISDTRGFEIVTHPISAEKWGNVPLESMSSFLTGKGYRSHDAGNCGLHVHISRDTLTLPTLAKMAIFVYTQQSHLEKLGRRAFGRHCQNKEIKGEVTYRLRESDRYGAINFCNRHTVEYRFPKGSLKPSTIRATVGLCFAITHFCQSVSCARFYDAAATWQSFVKFLHSHKEYANVLAYAKERGVC